MGAEAEGEGVIMAKCLDRKWRGAARGRRNALRSVGLKRYDRQ